MIKLDVRQRRLAIQLWEEMADSADLEEYADELIWARDRIEELERRLRELCALTGQQAEDEGLWFVATYASEAYLQQELRKLHAAIEEKGAH